MQKLLLTLLAAGAALSAQAGLDYTISGGSVSAQSTDPALVIQTDLSPLTPSIGIPFNLNDGQSQPVPFFMIRTDESTVNTSDPNDDTKAYPISATLMFSDPAANATVTGNTVGKLTGLISFPPIPFPIQGPGYGQVTWDGPADIVLGDREFTVTLNDAQFNEGFLFQGLNQDHVGTLITATVKQISSTVPDSGATATLLGGVLTAFGWVNRRLRR